MVKTKRVKKSEVERIEEIIFRHGGRRISKDELKKLSAKHRKVKKVS